MSYQKTLFTTMLVASASFGPATVGTASAEVRVVTTTTDLADFVRAVGRDRVSVESICQGVQDPHHVQARPSYMVTLSRADLLVSVGLDLEIGWLPGLIRGARNPDVNPGHEGFLEAASAITPMDVPQGPVDRSRGDLHPRGNPHFWLDPENAKRIVAAIARRLGQIDPDNASFYADNQRAWARRIDRAMVRWRERMAPYRGTKIVSYHQTFNYFHRRFGLVGVGYVEERPGIPPAPAHLARLIRSMRSDHIEVLFHERYYDEATSNLVARRTGAKVIVLPTSVGGAAGTSSYERLMDHIVDAFVRTMGGA